MKHLVTCAAILAMAGCPVEAWAQDATVAVLPVQAEGIGTDTLHIAMQVVMDAIAELEMTPADTAAVGEAAIEQCDDPGCPEAEQAAVLGESLEVDWVLTIGIVRIDDTVEVRMTSVRVSTRDVTQAGAITDDQGLLAALARVIAQVLPGPPDPCGDVDCSDHGTCTVTGEGASCQCDKGWTPDVETGLTCVPVKPKLSAKLASQESIPLAPSAREPVMAMAMAGLVLGGLSLAASVAGIIALASHMDPRGEARPGTDAGRSAFFALWGTGLAAHVIGLPLMLGSSMKAHGAQGLPIHDSQTIAAWSLYAVTTAAMGASFYLGLGYVFVAISMPILIAGIWVGMHEARQAIEDARATPVEVGTTVLPVMIVGKEGSFLGVAGSF